MTRILTRARCVRRVVLAVCACSVFAGSLAARDQSPGRPYFEEAYAAETESTQHSPTDPATQKAIHLYREALRAGLSREMAQAARWRLFYLYRETREYGSALEVTGQLGSDRKLKSVIESLYVEIAGVWQIDLTQAREYAAGLQALGRSTSATGAEAFLKHFRRVLAGPMPRRELRQDIVARLLARGRGDAALELLSATPTDEGRLARADLLVSLGRDAEARAALLSLSSADAQLSDTERAHLLYLQGRLARTAGDEVEAVRCFRLAATYAPAADAARYQSLVAFGLYRGGLKIQARAMLRAGKVSESANARLLELVLRAEVDRDAAALAELRQRREELEERYKKGENQFLVGQALLLLERAGAP